MSETELWHVKGRVSKEQALALIRALLFTLKEYKSRTIDVEITVHGTDKREI